LQIFRANTARKNRRGSDEIFQLGECKEIKLKSKKKFAADEKKFFRERKKNGEEDFFEQELEFYTGSEQLVYSLFTTAGKSTRVVHGVPRITSLRSLDAKPLRSYEFRRGF
jgi:hypothetical protein